MAYPLITVKRVALTLVFFGVCFIAFLILYPAYDTVAIRWPKLKSPGPSSLIVNSYSKTTQNKAVFC